MTSISASAAAGLLVALLVATTHDSFGAQAQPVQGIGNDQAQSGAIKAFDPQPEPSRTQSHRVAA
jgi:hypothetical protein